MRHVAGSLAVCVLLFALDGRGAGTGAGNDDDHAVSKARAWSTATAIAPIDNSAFIVENGRFTRVGRKGEVAAAARRAARRISPARPSFPRSSMPTPISAT